MKIADTLEKSEKIIQIFFDMRQDRVLENQFRCGSTYHDRNSESDDLVLQEELHEFLIESSGSLAERYHAASKNIFSLADLLINHQKSPEKTWNTDNPAPDMNDGFWD